MLGSQISFEGFYDRTENCVHITARRMVGDEIVYIPDDIPAPVAPAVAPAAPVNNAPAAPPAGLFSSTPGPSNNAGRARRRPSSSKKSGAAAPGANPRVSSRLADKRAAAAPTPAPASPTAATSINTASGAEILAGIDQEVSSASPFEALAMLASEVEALAASINASGLAALSPPRGNSEVVADDIICRPAVAAPQATIDTFFSARSSVLGKRKAEEGEVDSLRDAAATASLAEEERAYEDAQFDAVMANAQAALNKLEAARLAGENKRRKVSHVSPAGAPPAIAAAPAGPSTSKKGGKKLGVRKVATKKAAVPRGSGNVKNAAASRPKTRVDPCFPTAMEVDPSPAAAAVLGSITLEEGVRKSGRIGMRQSAAKAEAAAKSVHRRKKSVPTPADLW